ncbi:hypothetical protein Ndes2437B_g01414 [Nannochloris sp. 'desiccata']
MIEPKSEKPGAAQPSNHELDGLSSCMRLARRPFSLRFKSRAVEENYLLEVASGRFPVFIATASFDFVLVLIRVVVSAFNGSQEGNAPPVFKILCTGVMNLVVLYSFMGLIYRHSQRSGLAASRSEILLAALISAVLCRLASSNSPNSWIFVAFFLICTSTVLRLRWLIGAAALSAPVLLTIHRNLRVTYLLPLDSFTSGACLASEQGCIVTLSKSIQLSPVGHLPVQTVIHLVVAWAAGTLMGFISDDSRRQSFTSHHMALIAAATEVAEVRARVAAEKQLASAQALAEAKSLLVDRERASNEAKSEFISMLCHEIRTPLNGCLASAEMLLQTDLDEDQKDLAHTVRVSGSILLSTVSNFLDFFKLEAGKSLDIVRTPLDVGMLVADVHRIIEAMVVGGGAVKLLTPDLNGTPRTALGDPARLCGILLNMYMNAAKFTKTGSIGLKVRVVSKDYRPSPPPMVVEISSEEDVSKTNAITRVKNIDGITKDSSDYRCSSPVNGDEEEDQNNRTGGRSFYNSNSEASSSHHGSVDSFENIVHTAVSGADIEADTAPNTLITTSAPAASARITMSIQDEGGGWLSTASVPQLPNFTSTCTSICRTSTSTNTSTSAFSSEKTENEEEDVRWVSFEIHDTGCGIAPKSLSALFHDYVQGDADEMEKPRTRSGTGLGLAICGKQVAVLGGVIGALTKPGVGSVFWFKVPMLIPPGQENEQGEEGYGEDEYDQGVEYTAADINHHHSNSNNNTSNIGEGASASSSGKFSSDNNNNNNNVSFAAAAVNITGTTTNDTSNSNNAKRTSSGGLPRIGSDVFLDGRGLEHSWKSSNDATTATTPGVTPRPSLSLSQQGSSRRQSYSQTPQIDANAAAAAASGSGGLFSSTLEGLRVLVVEDNMINRKVACRVLQSLGIECEVASNGQEAVDAVASMIAAASNDTTTSSDGTNKNNGAASYKKLDVVLMDMCMPVLNGVEATKAIRNLGCTVPIVAMTANAEERDRDQCLAAGMNVFLSKPVLREQLAACILEAICSSAAAGGAGTDDGGDKITTPILVK